MTLQTSKTFPILDKNIIYASLIMLVLITTVIEYNELLKPEVIYNGYANVIEARVLPNCDSLLDGINRNLPAWYLVCLSYNVFGNARIIPFVFSLALLPLTFLVSQKITGSQIMALISTVGLAVNPIYLIFNDSAAYHQFWSFFFLLSVYLIYKKPILAGPVYFVSISMKALPLLFAPIMIYLSWKNKHGLAGIVFCAVVVALYIFSGGTDFISGPQFAKEPRLYQGLENTLWNLTKHTGYILPVCLTISLIGTFFLHKKVFYCILGLFLVIPILEIFTQFMMFPYRLVPLIVFMNIGCTITAFKVISHVLKIPYLQKNNPDNNSTSTHS